MDAARLQNWIWVGYADDVPLATTRLVHAGQGDIALFRAGQGRVYALLDRCPCHGRRLSDGIVMGVDIVCPERCVQVSLATGETQRGPAGYVPRYPTRIADGRLYLGLAALPRGEALG